MGLAVIFMALYFMPQAEKWLKVKPSSYKALSQALMLPDTGIVATKTGIRGRLDLVKSPHLRFAPGLSLKYTQAVDAHGFVFRDGDSMFSLYKKDTGNDFPKFMLSRAGYVMVPEPEDILVIPKNGGTAIAACLHLRVECLNTSDCNDGINATIDTCTNPGTSNAYCSHD